VAVQSLSLGRITALDGLRGIAILAVLEFHFAEGLTHASRPEWAIYNAFRTGWLGVDLFFVLSGYLITGILADSKGIDNYFQRFYWRRALRIFPPYYAFLFVSGICYPLLRHRPIDAPWWHWTYLTNLALALRLPVSGSSSHFWSLAVEEQFYLLWPLLVYLLSRKAMMRLCVASVAVALASRILLIFAGIGHPAVYVLMPCRMDTLAVGSWLALAQRSGWIPSLSVMRRIAGVAACFVAGVFVFRGFNLEIADPIMQSVGYTIAAIGFGALVVLATAGGWLQRICETRLLRAFGKVSYSIYIFHVPLHGALWLLFGFAPLLWWVPYPLLRLLPFLVVGPLACLGLGLLSWNLFEKHFLALKSYRFRDKVLVGAAERVRD
jgi:peptidoglycan/LPS O-acetylase OafA/YrhL